MARTTDSHFKLKPPASCPVFSVMKRSINQSYPKRGLRNRRITRGAHKRLVLEFNLLLALLGLRCCMGLSLPAEREGYTLLQPWASHCGGFSCCRAWALGTWASVVEASGLGISENPRYSWLYSHCGKLLDRVYPWRIYIHLMVQPFHS